MSDWQLSQSTVDFRNEERRAANAGPEILKPQRPHFDKCSKCGADGKTCCSWDPAHGWCCSNCGGCDSDE